MLDSRLETAEDSDQVVRALNVLVLKMVEKSDHTAMTRFVELFICFQMLRSQRLFLSF